LDKRISQLLDIRDLGRRRGPYFVGGRQVRLRDHELDELLCCEVKVKHCFEQFLAGYFVGDVRELRGDRSQSWLAREIGVGQPFVSRLERLRPSVSIIVGACLIEVLGAKVASPIFLFTIDARQLNEELRVIPHREFARRSGLSRSQLEKMLDGTTQSITEPTYEALYERE